MCSLLTFPPPPPAGKQSVCELNSELISASGNDDIVLRYKQMLDYKTVAVDEKDNSKMPSWTESSKSAFIEHKETVLRRITTAWQEQGNVGVLEEMANSKGLPWLGKLSRALLMSLRWFNSLHGSIFPHLLLPNEDMVNEFSSTADWISSPIRVFSWHPHTNKFAVALNDNNVKVYTSGSNLVPLLKHKLQKDIADLAWKPYSSSVLAVACQSCVLIWHIDPTSLSTRPSTSSVQVLKQTGHTPVTSLAWCPQGGVLITASPADTAMMVWNVAMEQSVSLRRVGGGGVSLVKWSPDGSKVFAATPSSVFRVWDTRHWMCEKWSKMQHRCQAACWSPDGSTLLFTTTTEAIIYCLRFQQDDDVSKDSIGGSKAAVCVADLSEVVLDNDVEEVVVGGLVQTMIWDPTGERLAVQFKGVSSPYVAIFGTKVHPVFGITPCGFVKSEHDSPVSSIYFKPTFEDGALLTVVLSSGEVNHIPLYFIPSSLMNNRHDRSLMGNGQVPDVLYSQHGVVL